jgi:hypothetical protein
MAAKRPAPLPDPGDPPDPVPADDSVPVVRAALNDMVCIKGHGCHWDDVSFGTDTYSHGLGGLLIVPRHAAQPLLHNGGYVVATPDMIQSEIDMLQARIDDLRQHLQ